MIKPLDLYHVPEVANIHLKALQGDFLPSLGYDFLRTFYEGVVEKTGVYGYGVIENGRLCGFVIGTKNSKDFFSQAFKSHLLKLTSIIIIRLIKNPKLLKNLLETFAYTKKVKGPNAELVIIAIDKKFQDRGLGKLLVTVLERKFKDKHIKCYKLTVHADKEAVGFYEHIGFRRTAAFYLYGKMWYVYEKELYKKHKS